MSYKLINVAPVAGSLGAEISGVDISADLDDEIIAEIRKASHEYLVVFFRDQELTPAAQVAFARRFGEITIYPYVKGMADQPEVVEIIKEPEETRNFGGLWHTDTSYVEKPPGASMLYAILVPPYGGDTLFANMCDAYDTLSQGMKDMLDGRTAIFSSEAAGGAYAREERQNIDPPAEVTTAVHPVVRTHPESGRKSLYVNGAHTVRFSDMTEEESRPILQFLHTHQQRPEFTCRFVWKKGSLAYWDNRVVHHNPINDYHGFRREMRRIILAGEKPF